MGYQEIRARAGEPYLCHDNLKIPHRQLRIGYADTQIQMHTHTETDRQRQDTDTHTSAHTSPPHTTKKHLYMFLLVSTTVLPAQTWATLSALQQRGLLVLTIAVGQRRYLSPDLNTHSVAYFAEAALKYRSAEETHVTCYYAAKKSDATTARMQAQVCFIVAV